MSIGLTTYRDAAAVRDVASIAIVDAALGLASHREFFTRDEAAQLLLDVRESVRDAALNAAAASVVNDALVSYGQDGLLDRRRVADPLLDIRLALTRNSSRTGGEDWCAAS